MAFLAGFLVGVAFTVGAAAVAWYVTVIRAGDPWL